jgi:hypothetical protein
MQEIEMKLRRLYRQRQALSNLIRAVEEYALVMGTGSGQKESVLAMVQTHIGPAQLGSAGRKPNASVALIQEVEKGFRRGRGVA